MKQTAYGKPLVLNDQGKVTPLNKVDVAEERDIQRLVFDYSECLPISDIDEAYNPLVPICTELNTQVGALDILMISPNGEICIVETKLWRNPEARRKVVAQILDYAQELSSWTYEDLQREINRRLGRKENTLYEQVKSAQKVAILAESDFVDAVSRNLQQGRMLLLIAGDGIREGTAGIAEFLTQSGHLNFTFALVELNVYEADGVGQLLIPKTLAKTTELGRMTVEVPPGMALTRIAEPDEATPVDLKKEQKKQFFMDFWKKFIKELEFDDPGQPMPNQPTAENLYVYPGPTKKAWISAYFARSQGRVGVYFRTQKDAEGQHIWDALNVDETFLEENFGVEISQHWQTTGDISVRYSCEDFNDESNQQAIREFFQQWLNVFVNVLRPRIKKTLM